MCARLLLAVALASALFSLGAISHAEPAAAGPPMVAAVPGTAVLPVHHQRRAPVRHRRRKPVRQRRRKPVRHRRKPVRQRRRGRYPYFWRGRYYRYRHRGLYFNHRYYRHGRWHYY
jgi:hypothetical protein